MLHHNGYDFPIIYLVLQFTRLDLLGFFFGYKFAWMTKITIDHSLLRFKNYFKVKTKHNSSKVKNFSDFKIF